MRKNILITGASSGLGEGMAREFAARGRNLALCARRTDRLERLKRELTAKHPDIRVAVQALDVNDHDQVFEVFRESARELGSLDRVVVNAGMGKGASLGTGYFHANKQTAQTNFVAALAQFEAALEIFRRANRGHLVAISSVSAVRGMRGAVNCYSATKAGLAALAEGARADLLRSPIHVSTIYPGYIATAINEDIENAPFRVDLEKGSRALVAAIESEKEEAYVPWWPWTPLAFLMRRLPLSAVVRMT